MKNDVCIVTADRIYAQWILLELAKYKKSVVVSSTLSNAPSASVYIIDTDSVPSYKNVSKLILFGMSAKKIKEKNIYLTRPFTAQELIDAYERVDAAEDEAIYSQQATEALKGKKYISHADMEISLTEKEYALYSMLWEAKGKPVSREALCEALWGKPDDNSLNLYIHYLRQKLEANGAKAIRSHRGKGYSIILRKGDK